MSFLGKTKILMADKSDKNIEDIIFGDVIIDYAGNSQTVIGLISEKKDNIITFNDEITCSLDSAFLSSDGKIISFEDPIWGGIIQSYRGENKKILKSRNWGLNSEYMKNLVKGSIINSIESVFNINKITINTNDEILYNLKTSGSGTYITNGYVTLGWANIWTWNYNTWEPLKNTDLVDIIYCLDRNIKLIEINFNPDNFEHPYLIWDKKNNKFVEPVGKAINTTGPIIIA